MISSGWDSDGREAERSAADTHPKRITLPRGDGIPGEGGDGRPPLHGENNECFGR